MKKLILMIILTFASFVICNAAILAVGMELQYGWLSWRVATSTIEDVAIEVGAVLLFQLIPARIMYKYIKLNKRIHKKIFWVISVSLMLLTTCWWVFFM